MNNEDSCGGTSNPFMADGGTTGMDSGQTLGSTRSGTPGLFLARTLGFIRSRTLSFLCAKRPQYIPPPETVMDNLLLPFSSGIFLVEGLLATDNDDLTMAYQSALVIDEGSEMSADSIAAGYQIGYVDATVLSNTDQLVFSSSVGAVVDDITSGVTGNDEITLAFTIGITDQATTIFQDSIQSAYGFGVVVSDLTSGITGNDEIILALTVGAITEDTLVSQDSIQSGYNIGALVDDSDLVSYSDLVSGFEFIVIINDLTTINTDELVLATGAGLSLITSDYLMDDIAGPLGVGSIVLHVDSVSDELSAGIGVGADTASYSLIYYDEITAGVGLGAVIESELYVPVVTDELSAGIGVSAIIDDVLIVPAKQDLYANETLVTGGWNDTATASGFLEDAIGEGALSADYMFTASNPSNAKAELRLQNSATPGTPNVVMHYTYRKSASAGRSIALTFDLLQGATIVATVTVSDISGVETTGSYTLTSGEMAAITNYGDLRLHVNANASGGGAGRAGWVYSARVRLFN